MTSRKVYEVWYTAILRAFLRISLYIMLYRMDFVIVDRILSKYVSFHAWTLPFDIPECLLKVF
jgi:hypothetical protein